MPEQVSIPAAVGVAEFTNPCHTIKDLECAIRNAMLEYAYAQQDKHQQGFNAYKKMNLKDGGCWKLDF